MNHKNNADKTVLYGLWEKGKDKKPDKFISEAENIHDLIERGQKLKEEVGKDPEHLEVAEFIIDRKWRTIPFNDFVEEHFEKEKRAKTFTEAQRREILETLANKVAWSFGILLHAERHHAFYEVIMGTLSQYYRMKTWRDRISNREELENCMDDIIRDMSSAVKTAFTQDKLYHERAKKAVRELLHEYELDSEPKTERGKLNKRWKEHSYKRPTMEAWDGLKTFVKGTEEPRTP